MTGPDERTWRREVGVRIRGMRHAAGWTQVRLGRAAGVSHHTVSALELGRVTVDLAVVGRLADALQVPASVLLGDQP